MRLPLNTIIYPTIGTILYFHFKGSNTHSRLMDYESTIVDNFWFCIFLPTKHIFLCFCYFSPNSTDFSAFFAYNTSKHKFLLFQHLKAGDFNLYHTKWLNSTHTKVGVREDHSFFHPSSILADELALEVCLLFVLSINPEQGRMQSFSLFLRRVTNLILPTTALLL